MKAPVDVIQFQAFQDPCVRNQVVGFLVVSTGGEQIGLSGIAVTGNSPVYE